MDFHRFRLQRKKAGSDFKERRFLEDFDVNGFSKFQPYTISNIRTPLHTPPHLKPVATYFSPLLHQYYSMFFAWDDKVFRKWMKIRITSRKYRKFSYKISLEIDEAGGFMNYIKMKISGHQKKENHVRAEGSLWIFNQYTNRQPVWKIMKQTFQTWDFMFFFICISNSLSLKVIFCAAHRRCDGKINETTQLFLALSSNLFTTNNDPYR